HVTKRERGAIRGRELGHCRHDLGDLLAAHRGRLGADVGLIGTLGQLVDRCLASVPALDVVEARVGRDPVEPRTEWQRGVVLVQSAIGANKSLLRTIVRRVGVPGDAERDVEHPSSVSFDQSRVRIRLTGKTCLDDVLVGIGQRGLRRPGARSSGHSDYPLGRGAVSLFSARSMDMTWLGHACVRMRGREGVVLADPPDPKSGHAIPKTEAAIVTISHDHAGHSSLKSVGGEPVVLRGPGEYEVHEVLVTGIGTFHDDSKGSARGPNTVFAIRLDDLVICHLGDLGHELTAADLERLGDVDIVLVPISGGDVNLTAAKAAEVIHQLQPKVVVPMSYDPDAKKDTHAPFDRLLHELGVKELTPVAKLSVTRSSLPENVQVVALDSRAR